VDALMDRLPALLGWAGGFAVVLVVATLLARRRQPMVVVQAAAAVPIANVVSGSLRGVIGQGDAVDAALIALGIHGLVAVATAWGSGIVFGAVKPEDLAAPKRPAAPPPPPPPPPPPKPRPAVVKPVAAGGVASPGPAVRSERRKRGTALMKMLEHSSQSHRAAACRALAVPFGGKKDVDVGRGLLKVIDDPEGEPAVRAEAAITLGIVFDQEVVDEQALRGAFEVMLNRDWLESLRALIEG
jgi:hypothetical protein